VENNNKRSRKTTKT